MSVFSAVDFNKTVKLFHGYSEWVGVDVDAGKRGRGGGGGERVDRWW